MRALGSLKPEGQRAQPESPRNPPTGSKQPLPGTGTAILPTGLGWSGFVQRAVELAEAPTPRCLSSRNARLHQQPEDRHSTGEGGLQEQVSPVHPGSPPAGRHGQRDQRVRANVEGTNQRQPSWSPARFRDKRLNAKDHLGLNCTKP